MDLVKEYQKILDEGFKSSIPEWDSLSPFDPMKVISESMSASLASIERRQHRLVNAISDSLPALFAFPSKPAQSPTQFFAFTPAAKLSEPTIFAMKEVFRFQSDNGHCEARPKQLITVRPIRDFLCAESDRGFSITFRYEGQVTELPLFFVPGAYVTEAAEPSRITLTERKPGNGVLRSISSPELKSNDQTSGFRQPGNFKITVEETEGDSGPREVELEIEFPKGTRPRGMMFANVGLCEITRTTEELELGMLRGEPWEQLALSPELVHIPEELTLHFPDDRTLKLQRAEMDLLRLKNSAPEAFGHCFFYNAAKHELVFPCADQLLGEFNGGVRVRGAKVVQLSEFDAIPTGFVSVADHPKHIEQVIPLLAATPRIERETSDAYLERFYSALRVFARSVTPSPGLVPDEVISQLMNFDARILRAECRVDAETQEAKFYLLTKAPSSHSTPELEAEIFKGARVLLNKLVPLDYKWSVHPFREQQVTCRVDLRLNVPPSVAKGIDPESARPIVQKAVDQVFYPPPFGQARAGVMVSTATVKLAVEGALRQLESSQRRFSMRDVARIDVRLLAGSDGTFREGLCRESGALVNPKIEISFSDQLGMSEMPVSFRNSLRQGAHHA